MLTPGSLEWRAVSADLVAAPVADAVHSRPSLADVVVAPIDPSLADTAAFCERYAVEMDDSANCVVIAGRRGDMTSYAACVVLATTGMEYGGITPIGLPADWPILIDGAVLRREVVVIGSGVRRSKLALPAASLADLPMAEVIEGLASAG